MSDHLLKTTGDFLDAGYTPGTSLNAFHDKLVGEGQKLQDAAENDVNFEVSGMSTGATVIKSFVATHDLEVVDAYAARSGSAANTATVAVAIDPATDNKNPLDSATVDIDALTDQTPVQQTLNSTATNLTIKKGQLVTATFTTGGSGSITSACLTLRVKPLAAGEAS